MIRSVLTSLVLAFATVSAQADLVSEFNVINGSTGKGPFGYNVLQSETGRALVRDGKMPGGPVIFQAAYRNDSARALATNHNFYVGNLFTTNYYELIGEYVFGDAYGNHRLDHAGLLGRASMALPKAASMVRSWVLEKHYIATNHTSKLARSFLLRGISDMNNEQTFTVYFMNFYLSAITEDYQFLPAYLLAKGSPVTSSSSLEKARVDIANLYDSVVAQNGGDTKSAVALALYKLRNAIHNQLSVGVIAQIDSFTRSYPNVGKSTLASIRAALVSYYSVTAQEVAALATKAGASAVAAAANAVVKGGSTPATLLALSQATAGLRSGMLDEGMVPTAKKTDSLVVLFSASQFLNKEINSMKVITDKAVITTLVNLVYIEGFLIKDNWQYFLGEVNSAADAKTASAIFADMSDIANATIDEAFKPTFAQWKSIDSKMQGFVDNTIKSSALNTASTIVSKIR